MVVIQEIDEESNFNKIELERLSNDRRASSEEFLKRSFADRERSIIADSDSFSEETESGSSAPDDGLPDLIEDGSVSDDDHNSEDPADSEEIHSGNFAENGNNNLAVFYSLFQTEDGSLADDELSDQTDDGGFADHDSNSEEPVDDCDSSACPVTLRCPFPLMHHDYIYSMLYDLPVLDLARLRAVSIYWVEPIARILIERPRVTPIAMRRFNRFTGFLHVSVIGGNFRSNLQFTDSGYDYRVRFTQSAYNYQVPQAHRMVSPLGFPMQSCSGVIFLGIEENGILLYDAARETSLTLSPGLQTHVQCVGLGYSGGIFKVVVWFSNIYHQNCAEVFTFGSHGSSYWRAVKRPPFRVMAGRAPFIQGCIHILYEEMDRMADRIAVFDVDSEIYMREIRFPEFFYSTMEPFGRHLAELSDQLSVCFSLSDTLELWRIPNYEDLNWVKEYTIARSTLPVLRRLSNIFADPIGLIENGQLLLNVIVGGTTSLLVLYDTFLNKVKHVFRRNCSAVLATESMIPPQALELDDWNGIWHPVMKSSSSSDSEAPIQSDSDDSESDIVHDMTPKGADCSNLETSCQEENVVTTFTNESFFPLDIHFTQENDAPQEGESSRRQLEEEVRYPRELFTVEQHMLTLADLGMVSDEALFYEQTHPRGKEDN